MAELELCLREAELGDAEELIQFLNQVGSESDYMSLDEKGIGMSLTDMENFISYQAESQNQLYLLALLDGHIAGILSITQDTHFRVSHIGNLFIVVKKTYWNQGLGRILLEEGIDWAKECSTLHRLDLTVQVRNQSAVHLYQSLGFEIEGLQRDGARIETATFVDVYQMGMLLHLP